MFFLLQRSSFGMMLSSNIGGNHRRLFENLLWHTLAEEAAFIDDGSLIRK